MSTYTEYNKIKSNQLGMSFGKANQILRKKLMFSLIQKCTLDICFRCNKKIETVDELSLDHKEEWLHSTDPVELFFNLDNVVFSHLKFNISSNNRNIPKIRRTLKGSNGYKGVYFHKNRKKPYQGRIAYNGRCLSCGYFDNPKEAAKAYDAKAIELYGERAVTNAMLGLI
ncbi:hypothetical protein ACFVS2_26475 [Brevibacillus sp. NPDC058079]|uniref:hypothetical protein n=1 Tax=Brevibacillus sp. NPDC058079 TaxID=3346330 RepID=UPI0036E52F10